MELINPSNFHEFDCPSCGGRQISVNETIYLGLQTLASCLCNSCGINFYHTYPIGHAVYFPVSFTADRCIVKYLEKSANWFASPLIENFFSTSEITASVEVAILNSKKHVVLLNCLDNCYGHSLSKLLNANYYLEHQQSYGLIVIIPKNLAWAVPRTVSEIWTVDLPFNVLDRKLSNFDSFVKGELERFDSVFFSPGFLHHDFPSIDFVKFFKVSEFNLDQFVSKKPVITFVFREDRVWLNNSLIYFLWKVTVKTKFNRCLNFLFIGFQNFLINKTAKLIAQELEEVVFFAVGMGKTGILSTKIKDLRSEENIDSQQDWCHIYSQSHLVIGMHGSNMFIPSALSAGFIEILPRERISNYLEDIANKKPIFFNGFLSRILDIYSTPKLVAKHATETIKGFPQIFNESFIKH